MRIALVTPGFSANDDDWCIPVLQDHARRLNEDHDVHVISISYPYRADSYFVKGVSVSAVGDGSGGRLAIVRRLRKARNKVLELHEESPFDIVHGVWTDQGGVVARAVSENVQIPSIVTVMAGELTYTPAVNYGKRRRLIDGRLAVYGARGASELIVNSAFHLEQLRDQQDGLDPVILPYGCNTERFAFEGDAKDLRGDIPILCVGSLVPVKGHSVVLDAIALVAKKVNGIHLHIVGDGELRNALQRQADDLGITKRVTFHGHVEHHELAEYYRGATFCVLGSFFESHGMVVLEAAACGRLTVGSNVGSMPDIGAPAFLVKPGDIVSLSECIEAAARTTAQTAAMGRDALGRISAGFTLDQSVQGHVELYAQAIANFAGSR